MYWSRYYIPTLKEAPSDAEVISHKLMTRAGMIRKLTAGVYTYLPFGWRAINKVAQIVREEMNRAGALELVMPTVQPGDLWKESGRWEQYGKELLRFKDRHDRECCLGPTHEEVITDLLRGEVRSYKQLPLNLYQIQTKFRDEIRPRFGLMRGREFLMKDAYSFDKDDAGAEASYHGMYEAYKRIFTRLGLRFRAVEADSGSIGGSYSHEFMVLAQTGEDVIAACKACEYAANVERAEVKFTGTLSAEAQLGIEEVPTPGAHTVEEVAAFMKVAPQQIVKTLILAVDGKPVAALVRGDRELNPLKVKNYLNATTVEMATPDQVREWSAAPVGFAGPVRLPVETVLADLELQAGANWVTGANKGDTHYRNVNLPRDAKITAYADLRLITEGDHCPRCGGAIELPRGIEVGHVFKLGLKYSKALNAGFLDENGKEQLMVMGCYGIGVTRVVAACIEQNNDADGIIFPPNVAPYEALVLNLDVKSEEVRAKVEEIYNGLQALGLDVLVDDREERPGVKFKDADLIGAPMQLIVGAKSLARGVVETKDRRTGEKGEIAIEGFMENFKTWLAKVQDGWKNQG